MSISSTGQASNLAVGAPGAPGAPAAPAAPQKYGEQYPKTMVGKIEAITNPVIKAVAFFFYAVFNVVFVLLPLLFDHIINGTKPTVSDTLEPAIATLEPALSPHASPLAAARAAARADGAGEKSGDAGTPALVPPYAATADLDAARALDVVSGVTLSSEYLEGARTLLEAQRGRESSYNRALLVDHFDDNVYADGDDNGSSARMLPGEADGPVQRLNENFDDYVRRIRERLEGFSNTRDTPSEE